MRFIALFAASLAVCVLPATAGDWYAGVYGGANWDDVIAAPGVDSETGTVIGGVVGRRIGAVPGLRIEADLSFRQNEVDVFGFLTVDHDTRALLFNAAYDFAPGPIVPYVLAGVGYANTQGTIESLAIARLEASGVAWQLGGGFQAQLFPGANVGLGYRYFQAPEIDVLGTELSSGSNHSAVVTLNFDL